MDLSGRPNAVSAFRYQANLLPLPISQLGNTSALLSWSWASDCNCWCPIGCSSSFLWLSEGAWLSSLPRFPQVPPKMRSFGRARCVASPSFPLLVRWALLDRWLSSLWVLKSKDKPCVWHKARRLLELFLGICASSRETSWRSATIELAQSSRFVRDKGITCWMQYGFTSFAWMDYKSKSIHFFSHRFKW